MGAHIHALFLVYPSCVRILCPSRSRGFGSAAHVEAITTDQDLASSKRARKVDIHKYIAFEDLGIELGVVENDAEGKPERHPLGIR